MARDWHSTSMGIPPRIAAISRERERMVQDFGAAYFFVPEQSLSDAVLALWS